MSERGRVIFYDAEKRFGFIEWKGKGNVHFDRDSFEIKPPLDGDDVEFDVVEQPRGFHARNLRIISGASHNSGDIRYILPKDTEKIIDARMIDNFNLKLNKVPPFEENKNDYSKSKFIFFKVYKKVKVILNVQPDYSKIDIGAIAERHRKNIKKLNIDRKSIILKPDWRLVVGLGNESVYETSMTLHHIYGIPYIPGSAIKGVIRSYIITEKFGEVENGSLDLKNAEKRALHDQGFCDIFGCPEESFYKESRQGNVIFFDAFPLSELTIKPDIMNPHYSPYYSEGKPPADYHNPVPIFFLTVENTEFEFTIGIKGKDKITIRKGKFGGKHLLEVGFKWMKKALNEHGIGAKTAVGYGLLLESVELGEKCS